MKRSVLLAALVLLAGTPALASAQGGPGYLFKRPKVAIGFRAGYSVPTAGGQLFDFTVDEFIPLGADTLSSLGFDAPYIGGEVAFRPWERWDIALGVGWTRSRSLTEYRRWQEEISPTERVPIQQETTFEVVYWTLGTKYYLQDRGRQVGSLAWVPRRVAPFVGGGLGISSYDFVQIGDFVDTGTLEIFGDRLETSDEGLILYGSAGVDVTLAKNAIAMVEARYSWSKADVLGSYVSFNDIDLGGLQLMVGLGFQF